MFIKKCVNLKKNSDVRQTYSQNSTTGSTGVMFRTTSGSSSQDVTFETSPSKLTTVVVVQFVSCTNDTLHLQQN